MLAQRQHCFGSPQSPATLVTLCDAQPAIHIALDSTQSGRLEGTVPMLKIKQTILVIAGNGKTP
jgi:hypothetical protein